MSHCEDPSEAVELGLVRYTLSGILGMQGLSKVVWKLLGVWAGLGRSPSPGTYGFSAAKGTSTHPSIHPLIHLKCPLRSASLRIKLRPRHVTWKGSAKILLTTGRDKLSVFLWAQPQRTKLPP